MKAIGAVIAVVCAASAGAQVHFPPADGLWETVDPVDLGWCPEAVDSLVAFADARDSKALIVLHQGRIAVEHYAPDFGPDSVWYWASAGKSVLSTLVGLAEAEGLLGLDDAMSAHLGTGWTSLDSASEWSISVEHALSMATGLDDGVEQPDCTDPECLVGLADPGTRWAYHNGPYTLLHEVLASAVGMGVNPWLWTRLFQPIGAAGAYSTVPSSPYNRVLFSTARDMARFGLLVSAGGNWDGEQVIPSGYLTDMLQPHQPLNPCYGWLWWLNSGGSHMLPQLQWTFDGPLVEGAPADLVMALGKNDQKLHIYPSLDLVVVRMGNPTSLSTLAPSAFDALLWERIAALPCPQSVEALDVSQPWPNPVRAGSPVHGLSPGPWTWFGWDGRAVQSGTVAPDVPGVYVLRSDGVAHRFVVN